MREIFSAYVERGLSVRQIAFELLDRAIPSPTGKPQWGTSTIDRVLHNEAYIGTVYYNRHERIEGAVRGRKTRLRERPREEWIPIPVPAIIDRDTFDRVTQITHDNFKVNSARRGARDWLLRGLIECGHCHVGCSCHRSTGATAPDPLLLLPRPRRAARRLRGTTLPGAQHPRRTNSTSTCLIRSAKRCSTHNS